MLDLQELARHYKSDADGQAALRHLIDRLQVAIFAVDEQGQCVDQLFNSTEKRLARALLLMARYGEPEVSHGVLPRVSQQLLAETIGTTRSRVNFLMNKFRKLGFIDYNGTLKVNNSLLIVVLRD